MFSKRPHVDTKRSIQKKVIDAKKDSLGRLKHLKTALETLETAEAKLFFEENYSQIYYIFYDVFIIIECSVKQKVLGHKTHKEDFDLLQYSLEKILTFLPELLSRKWQCHSLTRIMKKMLHAGNSVKVRREAVRLFLMWYQILGENSSSELDAVYLTLVPGLIPGVPNPYANAQGQSASETSSLDSTESTFYSSQHDDLGPVWSGEISPTLPPPPSEQLPDNITRYFLECLLDYMVTQVVRIEWKEKTNRKQQRCFEFLFEKFKKFYLPHIFPLFSWATSIYKPVLDLPQLRNENEQRLDSLESPRFLQKDTLVFCQAVVVRWVTTFSHSIKKAEAFALPSPQEREKLDHEKHVTVIAPDGEGRSCGPSPDQDPSDKNDDQSIREHAIVSKILYATRENVDFVQEVFRQAFLMSFAQSGAMRRVIAVYKDWIYKNISEFPLLTPEDGQDKWNESQKSSLSSESTESGDGEYTKKFVSGDAHTKFQNMLQIFITNAANVFLLQVPSESAVFLDEQVDMCKRVLNIYRYMVMNIRMDRKTWEQILLVLLQITSLVVKDSPPVRKEDILGGRLAPALFQTLIVTWIKANLNVVISSELWDQFLTVLSSLTNWEELIKEWAKTMETLTRVLARQVYSLDLNDLPLNRPSEQKQKKKRGMINVPEGAFVRKASFSPQKQAADVVRESRQQQSIDNESLEVFLKQEDGSQGPSSLTRLYSISRSISDSQIFPLKRNSVSDRDSVSKTYSGANRKGRHFSKSKSLDCLLHRADSPCLSESFDYRSRSPSPTPSSGVESSSIKDSPMQIDVMVSSADNSCNNSDIVSTGEMASVMAGGTVRGWLPDVAVVLWRRMLGALGNINDIEDPIIHANVLEFLVELLDTLTKIRNNIGISSDNQSTPQPPELLPPIHLLVPWLFQAIKLPQQYQKGRLIAYRLLCSLTVRRHDIPILLDYLSQFYSVLHHTIVGGNQSEINTIVRYCGPQFFSLGIPGSALMLMDFIHAANTVASSSEVKGVPRTEAMSILGAFLCLPRFYRDILVLQPTEPSLETTTCQDLKDHIVNILLKASKREPAGLARCIALSSLGIFVYEELAHRSNHSHLRDAVNVMLAALRFNSRAVARVASDMLLLQCDHADYLLQHNPDLPCKIVETIATTLSSIFSSESIPAEDSKKLLLSLIFCLGEWCMHIPQIMLAQSQANRSSSLILCVFRVLNCIVTGKTAAGQPRAPSLTDLAGPDVEPNVSSDFHPDGVTLQIPSPSKDKKSSGLLAGNSFLRASTLHLDPKHNLNVVKLAARTVIGHLVNYLGHFPMGVGAAHLTSLVTEQDDVPSLSGMEMSIQTFHSPNIQLFVLNSCSILSLVEIPAVEIPGGGPTVGLTTGTSQVRVIIRDQSGKFSWDCSILYGPPGCSKQTSATTTPIKKKLQTLSNHPVACTNKRIVRRHRPPDQLPTIENSSPDLDNLDDLLQYLGHTSPECIPRKGNPLNAPVQVAESSSQIETDTINSIINQKNGEISYCDKHSQDASMVAKEVQPPTFTEPQSPFQHCRMLLDQLGFISWEKRKQFDLLKKNERLIRELRNLDNHKCRETHKIAVIYVAEGQEDKNSLLLNTGGSQAFEDFVSGLGWEVDLKTHVGFLGGLHRNGSTGVSAPYFATSFVEVIFHVATRMPASNEDDAMTMKLRHLGNDEVHIVWSEHKRDYRRGIIATEFCDILIVIYPINSNAQLYRIEISSKPEDKKQVPYFGPLFNGAIVDHKILPGLVRATAINASRAKRSLIPLYQNFYEERAKSLETIVQNHKEPATFEQFAASVYTPASSKSRLGNSEESATKSSSNNLAAVLLDSHPPSASSPNLRHAPLPSGNRGSPQPPPRVQRERPLSASQSHMTTPLSQH